MVAINQQMVAEEGESSTDRPASGGLRTPGRTSGRARETGFSGTVRGADRLPAASDADQPSAEGWLPTLPLRLQAAGISLGAREYAMLLGHSSATRRAANAQGISQFLPEKPPRSKDESLRCGGCGTPDEPDQDQWLLQLGRTLQRSSKARRSGQANRGPRVRGTDTDDRA